jgi:GGDEF domain-containing protein
VAGLDGLRSYGRTHGPDAGDELLRRAGQRLGEAHPRVVRSADAEILVVLSEAGAPKAREAALMLRRLASEARGPGGASGASGVSVGFVSVGAGEGEPELVMDAVARPRRGQGADRGVVGSTVGDEAGRGTPETVEIVLAMAEAAESRGARTSGSIPGPAPDSRTS